MPNGGHAMHSPAKTNKKAISNTAYILVSIVDKG